MAKTATEKQQLAQDLGLDVATLDNLILQLARSCKRREGPDHLARLQRAVQISYATNRLVGDDLQAVDPVAHDQRTDGQGNVVRSIPQYAQPPVYVFPDEEPAAA